MAKEPSDRFASMEEFADELERCLAELGPDNPNEATMVVPAPARAAPPAALPELAPAPPTPRHGRRVWPPLVLAGLVAAGVVAALFALGTIDLHRGSKSTGTISTGTGTTPTTLRPVALHAVATWDPDGTGAPGENDGEISGATDGASDTYWSTEGYDANLSELGKRGVGLVLDTGGKPVGQVRVVSDTPGFSAQIEQGRTTRGPFSAATSVQQVGASAVFALRSPTRERYLLVWITKLAQTGGRYRTHLNEVTAKG